MTDKLREACRERCAEAGDPPCYRFDDQENVPFTACSECLNEVGESPTVPLDPDAVIRNLI